MPTYLPIHIYLHACLPMPTYLPIHTYLHAGLHMPTYLPIHTYLHAGLPIYLCIPIYMPIHTYTYLYIPIHTCLHAGLPIYLYIPICMRAYLSTYLPWWLAFLSLLTIWIDFYPQSWLIDFYPQSWLMTCCKDYFHLKTIATSVLKLNGHLWVQTRMAHIEIDNGQLKQMQTPWHSLEHELTGLIRLNSSVFWLCLFLQIGLIFHHQLTPRTSEKRQIDR